MPPGGGVGLSKSRPSGFLCILGTLAVVGMRAIVEGLAVREDVGAPRFQDAVDHDEDVIRHEAPDHSRDRRRNTRIWPERLADQGRGKKADDEQQDDCTKISASGRCKLQWAGASAHVLHPRAQPDHSDYEHRGENDYQVLSIHGHTPENA
jgi:hypothetical protein